MESSHAKSPTSRSRRAFMADAVMWVGGLLGLGSLAFRFAQYLYPVIPAIKWVEVKAAKVAEIPENGVHFVNLPEGPLMLEKANGKVRALSAICTHMGCIVHWYPKKRRFICPCHHGNYSFGGKVLSGPPPRPLPRFKVRVEKDWVYVRMQSTKEEHV